MKKATLVLAAVGLALSAGSAMAQRSSSSFIVKGLDNPFFEAIHQGCEKWNKENASSPYACFYTGPASTSDEAGEAQIGRRHPGQVRHGRGRHLSLERAPDRQTRSSRPIRRSRS